MKIRVPGRGSAGSKGGPSGDLYVVTRVTDHPVFERQGDNFLVDVPVSFVEAALGAFVGGVVLGRSRYQHQQAAETIETVTTAVLAPIFFATAGGRQVSHAGIYVGEGRFVHAPRTGGTVRLDSLAKPYWQNSYLQAKRVLVTPSLAGGY